MKKILQQENAAYFKLPTFEEIPDVGLYLEQTATFINKHLEPLLGSELTPSMISNYVKKKMIARPEKKQYSREQIAYLFFITISKTVLALDDLKLLVKVQRETYPIQTAYTYFREELEQTLLAVFEEQALSFETGERSEQKVMLYNIIIAVAHKIYLEKYFQLVRQRN